MGKIRKAIASISMVAVLSTLVLSTTAFAYTDVPADHWGYSYVEALKADGSFKDAEVLNANSNINRAETAKVVATHNMLVGETLGSSIFSDVKVGDWFDGPIGVMNQFGIMTGDKGSSPLTVRPNADVNRAELAKMLSIANGLDAGMMGSDFFADAEAGSWYDGYLGTAYCYGVIGGFADGTAGPAKFATRVEAAKMIVKASEGVMIDACKDGPTPPPVGGDLVVSLSSDTPDEGQNIPKDAASVVFTTIKFEAADEDVLVDGVTVTRSGLGDEEDFQDVWFATTDGARVSTARSLNQADEVELTFDGAGLLVEAGESVELNIVAELSSATAGTQHAFGIKVGEDVTSSAASVAGDFPVTGSELEVSDYEIGTLGFTANGSGKTVDVGAVNEELGEFRLTDEADANNTDINVRAVTLEVNGTIDANNVANMALYQAGVAVSEVVESPSGDWVSFVMLEDGYSLMDGDDRVFEIRGDVIGGSDAETIIFSLDEGSDVLAEVPELGMFSPRVVNSASPDSTDATASNVNLNTYTVNAGKLALAKDVSSTTNQTVAADTDEFSFLTLRVTVGQDITISSIAFDVNANNAGAAYGTSALALAGVNASLDNFKLVDHAVGTAYTEGDTVASESDAADVDDSVAYSTVTFSDEFELTAGTHLLTFVSDILPAATADDEYSVTYTGSTDVDAEYSGSGDTVAAADITGASTEGAEFTVGSSTLDLSRTDGYANGKSLVAGASDFQLMEFVIDNNDVEGTTVTDMQFGQAGTLTDASVVNNCVINDENGVAVSDEEDYSDPDTAATDADASLTFNDLELDLDQNGQMTLTLNCDITTSAVATENFQVQLDDVDAEDGDGDATTVREGGATLTSANPLDSASFTVTSGGTLTVSVDPNTADTDLLVGAGSSTLYNVATYRFSAQDDNISLSDFTVRTAADDMAARVNKLYLYAEDGTTLLDEASLVDVGPYAEADFSLPSASRLHIEEDDTAKLIVKAKFNNISEIAQTGLTLQTYVSNDIVDNIEAISDSTGTDVASGSITISGTGVTTDLVTSYLATGSTDSGLNVIYTIPSSTNLLVGDSVIVLDSDTGDTGLVLDSAATVTNVTSTTVSVENSTAYAADTDDRLLIGSVSSAASGGAIATATARVLTVPAGHNFEVGDTPTYVIGATGAAEDQAATVTAVSATTVTLTLSGGDGWDAAVAVGDYIYHDATIDRAVADEFVVYATTPTLASANLQDATLGFTSEEVYRFTVAANAGGDLSFSRVTFEVSQTDTELTDFELRRVDSGGSVIETPILGATTTAITLDTTATDTVANTNYVFDVSTPAETEKFVVGETVRVTDGTATVGNQIATVTAVDMTNSQVTLDPVGAWTVEADVDQTVTVEQHVGSDADAVGTEVTSGYVVIDLGTEEEVSAGQTKTYELRATTSDQGQQDTNSVSTRVLIDTSRTSDSAAGGYTMTRLEDDIQDALARFIWSDQPNNADHVQATSADYHAGYLVDGAPTVSKTVSN